MAKCKLCRKTVRWIHVFDELENRAKWIAVDPRSRPVSRHQCKVAEKIKALPKRTIDDPWWTK